jgi:hypothetical protein
MPCPSHRYTRCIVPETLMDYPAGTVLGIIRIELCFDLPMAIVFLPHPK